MSEIHRYKAVKILTEVGNNISYTPHGPDVVMAADFDRVTAERDALQTSLDAVTFNLDKTDKVALDLQQRLTEADKRAVVLDAALAGMLFAFDDGVGQEWSEELLDFARKLTGAKEFKAALNPPEGGGDHVKHYECIGKGGDYTVVAIAQGAGTLKGFNHYVYKNADGVHFVRDPEDFLSRMQIKP